MVSLGIFSVVPPIEPCALRSTQPPKVSTSPGVKAAGAFCRNVKKIRGLNLPGTPWATSACRGRPLLYIFFINCKMDNTNFITLPPRLAGIKSVKHGILAIAEAEKKTIDENVVCMHTCIHR